MGKVEYELPHELGTLIFGVPKQWVGARADGVEALWIDNDSTAFKENVTLKITTIDKIVDADQLLDAYIQKLVEHEGSPPVDGVNVSEGRRSVTFANEIGGYKIDQHQLAIYARTADKSYIIALSNSYSTDETAVNLDAAVIR